MWYTVPTTRPQPNAEPKAIFPWEEKGRPVATRVFPKSREPTPPPSAETTNVQSNARDHPRGSVPAGSARNASLTAAITKAFSENAPPQSNGPPIHIFPWEANAPKATRVFYDDVQSTTPPEAPPNTKSLISDNHGNIFANNAMTTPATIQQKTATWDSLSQQTNTWDDDPDISRYMESFNRPKRAQVQVVHDSRDGTLPMRERRVSLKLTDFPTEIERPSLPVTPAPIKRQTLWGPPDGQDILPGAQGVPKQDAWVSLLSSSLSNLPNPNLQAIEGTLHVTCSHCQKQIPIIKLEELQRKSSLVMLSDEDMTSPSPPKRVMPESSSLEQVEQAANRAMNTHFDGPKTPTKPILREPHFEVFDVDDDQLQDERLLAKPSTTATGSKSPTRFSPIVLEGEAASERSSYTEYDDELNVNVKKDGDVTNFDYSGASLSPVESRSDVGDDLVSPKSTTVV